MRLGWSFLFCCADAVRQERREKGQNVTLHGVVFDIFVLALASVIFSRHRPRKRATR
jgi:hypothetical protein